MSFVLEVSKTGKDTVLYNNYKYRESYPVKNGDIVWRCLGRKCKALIRTNSEKNAIYSANETHSGPHPVTLRSMSPLAQSSQNHRMTTPESAVISPIVSLTVNTPDLDEATDMTPKLRGNSSTSDLLDENNALKEELLNLRKNRQIILDHSIESDKRLLRYTENLFLPPPSITSLVEEIGVPASSNGAPQVVDMYRRPYSDCAVQCDILPNASKDHLSKNETHECILAQNLSLQKNVEELKSKVLTLEERNSSLQNRCDILYEETRNMIDSIRSLEVDIKIKNNQIKELEEDLSKKCTKIHEINFINRNNYDTLMDYHMKYPKDNFKCLSERLLEEVRCRDSEIKTYKDMAGGIPILSQELQNVTSNRNNNTLNYTTSPKVTIPIRNKFSILQNATTEEMGFQTVINHRRPKQDLRRKHAKTSNHIIQKGQNAPIKGPYKSKSILNVPFTSVSVVGDSHVRYVASLMTERISRQTKITGVCKPGAGIFNIAPKTSQPAGPKTDCLVLLAGSNDVAAGRQNTIFRHLEGIVERCKQTSTVVVCSLPARHDLCQASPVHGVVSRVNHYIEELCNRQEGVHWLDISSIPRKNFTTHGLHLRACGKRLLAGLIVEKLVCLRTERHQGPKSVGTVQPPTHLIEDSTPVSSFTTTTTSVPATLPHESYAAAVSQSHARSSSDPHHSKAGNQSSVSGNMTPPKTIISGGSIVNFTKNMIVQPILVKK